MTLHPAISAVRNAVRASISDEPLERSLVVACSGGADSLALLAATVFEARGRNVVGVTVDHGLQDDSADQALSVVKQMAQLGVSETASIRVRVQVSGDGPEAAARTARYAVLRELADRFDPAIVLLGHTRDDQAETVLMGLTRGSGGRSIMGMPTAFGVFRRPLLTISRAQTEAACSAAGITWWRDPHNDDPRFLRARVRHRALPVLEQELGPGVAAALARTGDLVRDDVLALDELAERAMADYDPAAGFDVDALLGYPKAVRSRMLRMAAVAAGSPPGELFAVHVAALERQVANSTQLPKSIQLPGQLTAIRRGRTLRFIRDGRD